MFSVLKNRHVVIAMIVAPILAVITWFAVDRYVAVPPRRALSGDSYQLVAASNCRYQSGHCTLDNGDVRAEITARRLSADDVELVLQSGMPVTGAVVAVAGDASGGTPTPMTRQLDGSWRAALRIADPAASTLRLAMNIEDSLFFAETTAVFVDYETGFSQDNFSR